ncbi:MAG: tetratricopeptide repeat protein [Candidatus Eisenbacteria bacterium]
MTRTLSLPARPRDRVALAGTLLMAWLTLTPAGADDVPESGTIERAMQTLAQVERTPSDSLLEVARRELTDARFMDEILWLIKRQAEADTTDGAAQARLGYAYYKLKDWDRAIRLYERAERIGSTSETHAELLSSLYLRTGAYAIAAERYATELRSVQVRAPLPGEADTQDAWETWHLPATLRRFVGVILEAREAGPADAMRPLETEVRRLLEEYASTPAQNAWAGELLRELDQR